MDFCVGQLVRSKAGRDAATTLAVLRVEGDYLFLADGKRRPREKPKRKKRKHTSPTTTILASWQMETNKQLRKAIAAYDAAHPI